MSAQTAQHVFNALADPTRMHITQLVAEHGQMKAGEISAQFDISFPAISQHLKILKQARVLQMEKQAQSHLYALDPASFVATRDWLQAMERTWQIRFRQLDRILQTNQKGTS